MIPYQKIIHEYYLNPNKLDKANFTETHSLIADVARNCARAGKSLSEAESETVQAYLDFKNQFKQRSAKLERERQQERYKSVQKKPHLVVGGFTDLNAENRRRKEYHPKPLIKDFHQTKKYSLEDDNGR